MDEWTLFLRRSELKGSSNNLVNALHQVLSDPCPALSVTLEGLQSWVIKGVTRPLGGKDYTATENHIWGFEVGEGQFASPAITVALHLSTFETESSVGKLYSLIPKKKKMCEIGCNRACLWSASSVKQLVGHQMVVSLFKVLRNLLVWSHKHWQRDGRVPLL